MKEVFKAVKVTDRVYWVGAIDWAVRDFHGYLTSRGTTYNAYLVMAEKVTLIDTVKAPFTNELLARIGSVIAPGRIDYVVSNHSEPDHAGGLADVIRVVKPEKVFASKMGAKALANLYRIGEVTEVADLDEVSLGDMTITFAETRMCHWPDSMIGYLHEDKLLFSQDGFGMHLAGYERFADQLDQALLDAEAAKYYANILLPLSNFVTKALDKLNGLNLPLDVLAPDHGPIWRQVPGKIIDDYARWARQERTSKAVVVYGTMWKSTDLMARAVGEGLSAGGAVTRLMPLSGCHRSDVATELLDAGALVVGSPTINNQVFPALADVLSYVKGLRPKGLIGGAFGSSGWSGEAVKHIQAALVEMDIEPVSDPVGANYLPTDDDLKRCYDLGMKVAGKMAQ